MKQVLIKTWLLLSVILTVVSCDKDEKEIGYDALPQKAQLFIAQYFPMAECSRIVRDKDDGTTEYEAAHGTVTKHYYKYLKGEQTSTNPMATFFAWTGALRKRAQLDGLQDLEQFADRLEQACFTTLGEGTMTKDLVGLVDEGVEAHAVTSAEFIAAIRKNLQSLHS